MKRLLIRFHKYNLLVIIGLSAATLLAVLKFNNLAQIQFLLLLSLIFFYLSWALIYHFLDKSLTLEVMLEYILTSLLAIVVLYGVLL